MQSILNKCIFGDSSATYQLASDTNLTSVATVNKLSIKALALHILQLQLQ